jgi:SAM-dependent methyltransferase
MALSLNLPYPVCYAAVRAVRYLRKPRPRQVYYQDLGAYFEDQYQTSPDHAERFMAGFPFRGVILDIGSGLGGRAAHWIERGAERVINVDINRRELETGRALTRERFAHLTDRIEYRTPEEVEGLFDGAVLVDAFEHLTDPKSVLDQIASWLRPGGTVWVGSIGWYHWAASHLIDVPISWCQILFSEKALIRTVRTIFREPGYVPLVWDEIAGIEQWDRVERLRDRPGEPLNMLSLRQCRRIITESDFDVVRFDVHGFSGRSVPVARLVSLLAKVPVARELFHSYYTALLRKPGVSPLKKGHDSWVAQLS